MNIFQLDTHQEQLGKAGPKPSVHLQIPVSSDEKMKVAPLLIMVRRSSSFKRRVTHGMTPLLKRIVRKPKISTSTIDLTWLLSRGVLRRQL